MTAPLTRRERLRAETVQEIQSTARRMLISDGYDGLSLRAIARAMGMSAPALYRYYASREDLIAAMVTALKVEMTETLIRARDAHDDLAHRMLESCRAFRRWAVEHPAEFTLVFTASAIGLDRRPSAADEAGEQFGQVFAELITELYLTRPFPVPADDEIDEPLLTQLKEWCDDFPQPLPLGVSQVFLSCWIRLYGNVSMEVFKQLEFALSDANPMFEAELRGLATSLGVPDWYYPPTA
ncbi:TetR/AcrR family transcriptional regulator [Cryptosporangium aurantiacum]|uniref:Transcriptional regulator, TetR family n=1 Tax=Cryptosporangium aurantiacum TaxID=134849 RepID=A0A1M7MTR5_9ACTN|nr:TetR/AcrR family transcriptional regulator [Cryptosporangium aurantiacum]SHM94409.1 transcriptional regulator, TetR family [Cryptosporangium aurantiacum]